MLLNPWRIDREFPDSCHNGAFFENAELKKTLKKVLVQENIPIQYFIFSISPWSFVKEAWRMFLNPWRTERFFCSLGIIK